jgi:RES domain-containing protein
MLALYTSTNLEAAWREAQQGFAFKAQPLTICAYDVDCDDTADLADSAVRSALGVGPTELGCAWEDEAARRLTPASWTVARRLFETGIAAIIVPSFAPGALSSDRNIVFWRWTDDPPHQVRVTDHENRLPKNDRSWL